MSSPVMVHLCTLAAARAVQCSFMAPRAASPRPLVILVPSPEGSLSTNLILFNIPGVPTCILVFFSLKISKNRADTLFGILHSNSRERPPQYFDMSRCREEVEAELRPWYSGHQVPFPSTFCPVSSFNPQPNCVLSITIGGGGEVGGMDPPCICMDPPCICMDPPRVFFGSWILLDPPGSSWILLDPPGSFRILDPGSSWILLDPSGSWILILE